MRYSSVSHAIAHIEQHLEAVSAALISGEPTPLQSACEALRQTAVDFSHYMGTVGKAELAKTSVKAKMRAIAAPLGQHREGLARRSFIVDRRVALLVPESQSASATYGGAAKPGHAAGIARLYANRAS